MADLVSHLLSFATAFISRPVLYSGFREVGAAHFLRVIGLWCCTSSDVGVLSPAWPRPLAAAVPAWHPLCVRDRAASP